jgi:hypothetical protein
VVRRDAKNHYYSFEYKLIDDLDVMVYSVCKPFEDDPYTIMVEKFSQHGHTRFFTDIFLDKTWGKDVLNLNFLIKVWEELKLDVCNGPLTGELLNVMLEKRTKEFLPQDGICQVEPQVYRKTLDELLMEKASFGIKL